MFPTRLPRQFLLLQRRRRFGCQIIGCPAQYILDAADFEYYVNLLGMRKRAHALAEAKLRETLGRQPKNYETSNYLQSAVGMRGQLLAKSGANATVPTHKFNDEALVLIALCTALFKGRETVIVTHDEDVLEQFYKAVWLIDTHYRSMLFANAYVRDPLRFIPTRRIIDKERAAFDGELLLVPRSTRLNDVLPDQWEQVPVHCLFIRNNKLTTITFTAERQMLQVLKIKSETRGLNTEKLNGLNCHICLGNYIAGNFAGIGRDIQCSLPNTSCNLSVVDTNLCFMSGEGFVQMRVVDPRVLLLPPRQILST